MSWSERDDALERVFTFGDFRSAFAFMTQVAFIAEELGHHPEWSNVYGTVRIVLRTHDAGNRVTDIDREMASRIDRLVDP